MAEEQPERLRRVRDKNRESEPKQNENRKLKKKLQEKKLQAKKQGTAILTVPCFLKNLILIFRVFPASHQRLHDIGVDRLALVLPSRAHILRLLAVRHRDA